MRRFLVSSVIMALAMSAPLAAARAQGAPAWAGFAGNAQHTGDSAVAPQPLKRIHWKTPVDNAPQLTSGELLIHYASPMITANNTVLLPVKGNATGGFRVEARAGATGAKLWQHATDWQPPAHDWMPPLPAVLSSQNLLYMAGAGGTLLVRDTPDLAAGLLAREVFYGWSEYNRDRAGYNAAVQIATPLTSDAAGNVYFGFLVTGPTHAGLASGFARVTPNGKGTWVSAAVATRDAGMTRVAMNAAPAISNDGKTVYVVASNGFSGYLVALDSTTLATRGFTCLTDPASGWPVWLADQGSASPMVGPDGDVYLGVMEQPLPSHNDRGWLIHFDGTLTTQKIPGSFGWDNTASVVPAKLVPSYAGPSSYLLMTKYNNYLNVGTGNGHNRIAVIDPGASQTDPFATNPTQSMAEVESVAGPTADPNGPPGATFEWCINSAAVDIAGGTAIANSEDGHLYRWNLKTGALAESLLLNKPRPEAYTMTVIGPDGTVYAINNATFYAVGQ